jgi:hypothetical protein
MKLLVFKVLTEPLKCAVCALATPQSETPMAAIKINTSSDPAEVRFVQIENREIPVPSKRK